jgi:hypothetical protein
LFTVDGNDLLTPVNQKVPIGKLPQGPWIAIGEALAIQAPVAALPGVLERKVRVGLVRSGIEREANVLIAEMDAWREFGIAAPAIRLKNLRFALSASRALIWGVPAPPIPGARFVEENGIAVPCGFALYPLSDPEILWALLKPGANPTRAEQHCPCHTDLAIFFEDGTYDIIDGSLFVAATRSAIRQSLSGSVVA